MHYPQPCRLLDAKGHVFADGFREDGHDGTYFIFQLSSDRTTEIDPDLVHSFKVPGQEPRLVKFMEKCGDHYHLAE